MVTLTEMHIEKQLSRNGIEKKMVVLATKALASDIRDRKQRATNETGRMETKGTIEYKREDGGKRQQV